MLEVFNTLVELDMENSSHSYYNQLTGNLGVSYKDQSATLKLNGFTATQILERLTDLKENRISTALSLLVSDKARLVDKVGFD